MSLQRLKSLAHSGVIRKGGTIYYASRYTILELIVEGTTRDYIDTNNGRRNKTNCFLTLEEAEMKLLKINMENMRARRNIEKVQLVEFANRLKYISEKYAEYLI